MNHIIKRQAQIRKNILDSYRTDNLQAESAADFIEKGKKASLGEIREWNGKKMQKTVSGWIPATSGNKATPAGKEQEKGKYSPNVSDEAKNLVGKIVKLKSDMPYMTKTEPLRGQSLYVEDIKAIDYGSRSEDILILKDSRGDVHELSMRFLEESKSTDTTGVEKKLEGEHKVVLNGDFATIKVSYDEIAENYSYSGKTKSGASISGNNVSEERIKGIINGDFQNKKS